MQPKIYDYLNYRVFLGDYYSYRKDKNHRFSYTVWSREIGFKSRNFIREVIDEKKNLSEASIEKLSLSFKFQAKEKRFFRILVNYNQSQLLASKDELFQQLATLAASSRKVWKTLKSQHRFFSEWYHSTIRELLFFPQYQEGDPISIGNALNPSIKPEDVKNSLKLQLELGLISLEGAKYLPRKKAITTGSDVDSHFIKNYHRQNLQLAERALDEVHYLQRDLANLILPLSHDSMKQMRTELAEFRKKMMSIADADTQPEAVFHLNFNLFPVTHWQGQLLEGES